MKPRFRMLEDEMKLSSARDRRIYLSDEVFRDSIFEVQHLINNIVKKDKQSGTKEPITLVVDSYGGEIYFGVALVGLIESLKDQGYEIITETFAVAMSMGFVIAICGSHRVANRYARFMAHQPNSVAWGTLQDMIDSVAETEFLWVQLKDIIKKYSNITEEMLEDMKKTRTDKFYTAQEMLELGAIDEIL